MSSKETIKTLNASCSAILLDIEGTTTSIDFVKEVLFPYAKENAAEYLQQTWHTVETKEVTNELFEEFLKEHPEELYDMKSISKEGTLNILTNYIEKLIKLDRKVTLLKKLQGKIWRKAYEAGDITGHVYEDVKPMLEKWEELKIPVYIYSSGSIEAQKLLYRHSTEGNLLKYISGHFDTTIGHKLEKESYTKIVNDIGIPSQSIVFITDVPGEAEKAQEAGMKVIISQRPGTVLYGREITEFASITSFDQLSLSASHDN